jgi:hypothetical protein
MVARFGSKTADEEMGEWCSYEKKQKKWLGDVLFSFCILLCVLKICCFISHLHNIHRWYSTNNQPICFYFS